MDLLVLTGAICIGYNLKMLNIVAKNQDSGLISWHVKHWMELTAQVYHRSQNG